MAHPLFFTKKHENARYIEKKTTFARFIYSEFQQINKYLFLSILHL